MSRFAIELYFDDLTHARICSIWNMLDRNGLTKILCPARGFVPHISLAVAHELDPAQIVPLVKTFATQTKSIVSVLYPTGFFFQFIGRRLTAVSSEATLILTSTSESHSQGLTLLSRQVPRSE